MTRMLASVANAAEAGVVVQLGADVIDLKVARQGALGAVSLDIARQAIAAVAGRSETSAALGDPPYDEERWSNARERWPRWVWTTSSSPWTRQRSIVSVMPLSRLARDVALVGMMFADEKPDFALLADFVSWASRARCSTRATRHVAGSSRTSRSCSSTNFARSAARSS